MTDKELNRIMMRADIDLEMLKDKYHDLYDEYEQLKYELETLVKGDEKQQETIIEQNKKITEAIETLKDLRIDDATACRKVLGILEGKNEYNK